MQSRSARARRKRRILTRRIYTTVISGLRFAASKKEVHGDQKLTDRLKEHAKKIFEPLFIALLEYKLEERLPDEVLDNLYDQKKAEISELAEKMVQEWREEHGV